MLQRWFIATACACAGLAACEPREADNNSTNATEPQNQAATSVLPVAVAPLDREALLLAVMRSASSAALGHDDAQSQRELEGKRFELRIRFGCEGPVEGQQSLGWRFDEPTRTLRVSARPDVAAGEPLLAAVAGGDSIEEVEGFWIPRPWLLTAACPATVATTTTAGPEPEQPDASDDGANETAAAERSGPRVAVGQFFTATDARTGRRTGRAYEAVVALAEGEMPSREGYNLVLSGRLQALPGGKVIGCAVDDPGRPPSCIISAHIDEARMERPEDGAVLARWGR